MASRDPRLQGTPFESAGRAYVAEVLALQFQDGTPAERHLVAATGCAFAVDYLQAGVVRVSAYGPLGESDHLGSVTWTAVVQLVDGLLAGTYPNMPSL